MTCENCFTPHRTGKPPGQFRLKQSIKLLKIGELDDHDKMQCPSCKAIFWHPKDEAEQITFNLKLSPALL